MLMKLFSTGGYWLGLLSLLLRPRQPHFHLVCDTRGKEDGPADTGQRPRGRHVGDLSHFDRRSEQVARPGHRIQDTNRGEPPKLQSRWLPGTST